LNGLAERKQPGRSKLSPAFWVACLFLSNLPAIGLWYFAWRAAIHVPDGLSLKLLIAANSLLWLLAVAVVYTDLKRENLLKEYLRAWKRQGFLLAFLLMAFFSIFWSLAPLISAYKVWLLAATSVVGAYLGFRLGPARWLGLLGWFGGLVLFLSIAVALIIPGLGTMLNPPYAGAWDGIFWHKNQLGSLLALLNAMFLAGAAAQRPGKLPQAGVAGLLYLVSLVVIYLSASAAALLITVALNFLIFLILLWLKIYPRLTRAHYLGLLGFALAGLVLVGFNLDFVFSLVNRGSSLTGRMPMWAYLFQNVIARSPWFGYGFGALWSTPAFSDGLSRAVGWPYSLVIGDNGFLDILLHLGGVGLTLFLGVFVQAWARSIRFALEQRSLTAFLPLILMVFALLANLTFSLFLEMESFVWLWVSAVLFLPEVEAEEKDP
jgi:O-antigen ligase